MAEVFVPSKIIIFVLSGMPSIALSKVTKTTILFSGKRGPGNETLKKRKERTAFYNRFQPSAGPGKKIVIYRVARASVDILIAVLKLIICNKQ